MKKHIRERVRWMVLSGIAGLALAFILGASADNSVAVDQHHAVRDTIQYWRKTDGPAAAKALKDVTVVWDTTGVCSGAAGCAYVGGCTTLPAEYCKAWIYWDGVHVWGEDWVRAVLAHEFGHLLGYNHGDPTCTMNVEYC